MEEELNISPQPVEEEAPQAPETVVVADIHFRNNSKVYFFAPGELMLTAGDHVIIETARGPEYGIVSAGNHPIPAKDVVSPLRSVIRRATAADEKIAADNTEKEKRAYKICLQKIADHKLDMQLVSAEYAFDGSKILFFFTADDRVDFRELVKNLASIFHTRIELRQIGVRDKAKMVGGLGICGRPFCCGEFLNDFQPVSIKMAKTQNLSLNPTKISGTCGRLMCCLKYEQDAYESLIKTSPKVDSIVNTYDGKGTVTESSLLKQTVKVRLDADPSTVKTYCNCDICVLRNGKGKKTDPPIPEDLPPLPKPQEKKEEPEITMFDETVLSNYTPAPAPEKKEVRPERKKKPETPKPEVQEKAQPTQTKKPRKNKPKKPQAQKKPEPQKAEAPKADTAPKTESGENKEKKKSSNHRRRYYRSKKPAAKKEG